MKYSSLLSTGQLQKGDKIIIVSREGKVAKGTVKDILNPGKPNEEVIINKLKNTYFITTMVMSGASWAVVVAYAKRIQ